MGNPKVTPLAGRPHKFGDKDEYLADHESDAGPSSSPTLRLSRVLRRGLRLGLFPHGEWRNRDAAHIVGANVRTAPAVP